MQQTPGCAGLHTSLGGQVVQVPLQLVCPEGQHCPWEQLLEQQSPLPLQVPPFATQQVVPEQAPPVGQVTQLPLQLVWPDGQTQLVPEHTPPVGQVAQVPLQQPCPEVQQVALL